MVKTLFLIALGVTALLLAACGTIATPVWEGGAENVSDANVTEAVEVAQDEPTEIPATATEQPPTIPPTATVTHIPSATPIPPTATASPIPPTTAPTAIPTQDTAASGNSGASGVGDAAAGEQLFTMGNGAAAPCSSCHMPNSDMTLVGPGMLGLGQRAGSRVPGESAEEYLHNAILHPNDFVVPGFAPGLMPQNFADTLSTEEINNLVAYLLTL